MRTPCSPPQLKLPREPRTSVAPHLGQRPRLIRAPYSTASPARGSDWSIRKCFGGSGVLLTAPTTPNESPRSLPAQGDHPVDQWSGRCLGQPTEAPHVSRGYARRIGKTSAGASSRSVEARAPSLSQRGTVESPAAPRVAVASFSERYIGSAVAARLLLGCPSSSCSEPEEVSCLSCCSTAPVDVVRRRRCPASTPVARRRTRVERGV
jgi:hypothetical protein